MHETQLDTGLPSIPHKDHSPPRARLPKPSASGVEVKHSCRDRLCRMDAYYQYRFVDKLTFQFDLLSLNHGHLASIAAYIYH